MNKGKTAATQWTVREYLDEVYIRAKRRALTDRTIGFYRYDVELFDSYVSHPVLCSEVNNELLEKYRLLMVESGYSHRTARSRVNRIKTILRHWNPKSFPVNRSNVGKTKNHGGNPLWVPKYGRSQVSKYLVCAVVQFNGRRHYLGEYGSAESKAKYHRMIAEWEASGRSALYGLPAQTLTVEKLVFRYMEFAKQYYGDASRGEYANMLNAIDRVADLYGPTLACEFGPLQFKAIRQSFISDNNSRQHINAKMRRIIRMFRWAVGDDLISPEIPTALSMVPGLRMGRTDARESKGIKPVMSEVVDATLPHLHPVVRAMVEFQRFTGCRPAEVCALRPCDVQRDGEVWQYRPSRHKTSHYGKSRTVYIGPKAQAILRPYLLRAADAFCFSPKDVDRERREHGAAMRKTPMSCGNVPGSNRKRYPEVKPGDSYKTQSYANAIRRACVVAFGADCQHWSPNQLRHAAATEIRKAFGLEAAQVILGHSQADVTQIYAERDSSLAVRIAREVG